MAKEMFSNPENDAREDKMVTTNFWDANRTHEVVNGKDLREFTTYKTSVHNKASLKSLKHFEARAHGI
ncbi:unnamed protein product [Kuraishia capsulata CBS 1993]|uniref:Uncharacterized protein n=1 Tax=Kuraishia capsulata CBS 1993 TaxID=1382522 RepID=W6MJ92_9ASCO|nr:uncharacterized protein KUCA_T00002556001 [Kuraishia capsulata CBS 1993]CDK26584.1 unnamed protein product [Kuraishia capsulata CBS 1993]